MPDPTSDTQGQRGAKRDSLFLMTELRTDAGVVVATGRVRNLSATGMMVETAGAFRADEHVSFDLRGVGLVGGTVTWVREGRIGVRFDAAIDPRDARRPVSGEKAASGAGTTRPSASFVQPATRSGARPR